VGGVLGYFKSDFAEQKFYLPRETGKAFFISKTGKRYVASQNVLATKAQRHEEKTSFFLLRKCFLPRRRKGVLFSSF
jgi:hypothetical protein